MILALVFFALTLGVTAGLVWPLLRHKKTGHGHEMHDMAIYREQLAEVDNDIERGLLTKQQAEAARTEIYRRMLAVEDAAPVSRRIASRRTRKVFAALIAILLPVMAAALYLLLGSPELPGKPFAARANDPEFALAAAAEDMQSKLDKTPTARGYKHLADTLYMMKRYPAATEAYQKAVKLGANDAMTWSKMGESVVLANAGAVVPEAFDDFNKSLKLDPEDARSRFYIGLAAAQINNFKKAVAIWKGLQKDSPPDAPWSVMIKEHIEIYARKGGFDPASIAPSQPSGAKGVIHELR